jgi:hypothetical protein
MNANQNNQNNQNNDAAISDADLDKVAGGRFSYWFPKAGGSSGMNDPAQMFQQILNQLTQGLG